MMDCVGCGASLAVGDNFCRYCGTVVRQVRLPALVRDALPIPLGGSTLWRGLAALVLGTAAEMLRREVARRSTERGWLAPIRPVDPSDGVIEEVFIMRRRRR